MKALLAALIMSTAIPAVADAQYRPAYRRDGSDAAEQERTGIRLLNQLGRCVARIRPETAERVLAQPIRSPEQAGEAMKINDLGAGCFARGRLAFQPPLIAGAMAEHFIVTRYRDEDLAPIARLDEAGQAGAGLVPRTAYEDVALCVVRRNPAAVRALIDTEPASTAENAAMAPIFGELPQCLPAGQDFYFAHPTLRALVANGLYRILSVTRGMNRSAEVRQ